MKEQPLDRTLAFAALIHAFQRVERRTHVPGTERWENDAEHSFALAVAAWYLIESLGLPYDKAKVLQYALVHDMPEAYAGDTWSFSKDASVHGNKKEREDGARARIAKEFPDFPSLHAMMEKYEAQADEESRFVSALDKVMPIISGHAQKGRDWKALGVTFDEVLSYKREKIKSQKDIGPIFEELMSRIEYDKAAYFNKKQ